MLADAVLPDAVVPDPVVPDPVVPETVVPDTAAMPVPVATAQAAWTSSGDRSSTPAAWLVSAGVSSAPTVTLYLGSDYPVKMEFQIAGGKGEVRYLLAPRIESD